MTHHCHLNDTLTRFWEVEEVAPRLKKVEKFCLNLFDQTTTRDVSGRFVVNLPFKEPIGQKLGHTKVIAKKFFDRIAKKFQHDEALRVMYTNFLKVYEEMGHMTEISMKQASQPERVFIPHHLVFKVIDEQPKLRVVFNGNAKTIRIILNEFLLPGPKLLNNSASILINWRSYKFVLTADMVKMFRQILMAPEDRLF